MKKECYIVAGGSSLIDFDFLKLMGKDVITVNKAFFAYPNCKYFITMDFTFLKKVSTQKSIFKRSRCTKIFIGNLCPSYMEEKNGAIVDTRWNLVYNLAMFDVIIKSRRVSFLGYAFNDFAHGLNSGFCALQLAIVLGYTEIHLLGMDMNVENKTHFHEGYGESVESFNEKLKLYYTNMKESILDFHAEERGINIYSCSKTSSLNKFLEYKEL